MVVFVVIYIFIYLSTLLFAFPFISNPALLPIFTIINILTMLLFIYVSRSDPGYVIKKHRNLSNLFDCNPVERICPDCSVNYLLIKSNFVLKDQDIVIYAKSVLIDMIITALGYLIVLVKRIIEFLYYF